MRIFLYEFITGGGCWSKRVPPEGSLLAEGRAMVQAVALDFAAIDGVEIVTTRDARLPELHTAACRVTPIASAEEEFTALVQLAKCADWTLLIAPESGGALVARCRLVEEMGGRLLS